MFAIGKTNRATATTDMNEHSSRSHALLCVTVVGVNQTTGQGTKGNVIAFLMVSLFSFNVKFGLLRLNRILNGNSR